MTLDHCSSFFFSFLFSSFFSFFLFFLFLLLSSFFTKKILSTPFYTFSTSSSFCSVLAVFFLPIPSHPLPLDSLHLLPIGAHQKKNSLHLLFSFLVPSSRLLPSSLTFLYIPVGASSFLYISFISHWTRTSGGYELGNSIANKVTRRDNTGK